MNEQHSPHRWSGWPGAWCLDCGAECAAEVCLASNPDCACARMDDSPCTVRQDACPCPGAGNADPYATLTSEPSR